MRSDEDAGGYMPQNRWQLGKITDAELADHAGMRIRNLRKVLETPWVKHEIVGGGRGSKGNRRIPPNVQNAVAIVQAIHDAGITFDLAAQLVGVFWCGPDELTRSSQPSRDDYLEIINSRWVFRRNNARILLVTYLDDDMKRVCLMDDNTDTDDLGRRNIESCARHDRKHFKSKLAVNISLPIRNMEKRLSASGGRFLK